MGDFSKHYRQDGPLGAGPFADVYLGTRLSDNTKVCIKSYGRLGKLRDLERTKREFGAQCLVGTYPHLSPSLELLSDTRGVACIVTEYQSGGSADARLEGLWSLNHSAPAAGTGGGGGNSRQNPEPALFGAKQVTRIALELFRALTFAAPLVHGSIRPSNIFFDTPQGRAKLADFGLSIFLLGLGGNGGASASSTSSSSHSSSAASHGGSSAAAHPHTEAPPGGASLRAPEAYAPPEVLSLEAPTHAGDVWSVGASLLRLLTGRELAGTVAAQKALVRAHFLAGSGASGSGSSNSGFDVATGATPLTERELRAWSAAPLDLKEMIRACLTIDTEGGTTAAASSGVAAAPSGSVAHPGMMMSVAAPMHSTGGSSLSDVTSSTNLQTTTHPTTTASNPAAASQSAAAATTSSPPTPPAAAAVAGKLAGGAVASPSASGTGKGTASPAAATGKSGATVPTTAAAAATSAVQAGGGLKPSTSADTPIATPPLIQTNTVAVAAAVPPPSDVPVNRSSATGGGSIFPHQTQQQQQQQQLQQRHRRPTAVELLASPILRLEALEADTVNPLLSQLASQRQLIAALQGDLEKLRTEIAPLRAHKCPDHSGTLALVDSQRLELQALRAELGRLRGREMFRDVHATQLLSIAAVAIGGAASDDPFLRRREAEAAARVNLASEREAALKAMRVKAEAAEREEEEMRMAHFAKREEARIAARAMEVSAREQLALQRTESIARVKSAGEHPPSFLTPVAIAPPTSNASAAATLASVDLSSALRDQEQWKMAEAIRVQEEAENLMRRLTASGLGGTF